MQVISLSAGCSHGRQYRLRQYSIHDGQKDSMRKLEKENPMGSHIIMIS